MALMFGVLVVALVGWTSWWFWLVNRVETEIDARAVGLRDQGWTVEWREDGVSGWPFRARFQLRDVTLAAPGGHALTTPRLVATANAYAPTHWILMADKGLVLRRGDDKGEVTIGGGAARASVRGLGAAMPTIALQLSEPTFTPHPDAEPFPISGADRLELHLRQHGADGDRSTTAGRQMDIFFRLEGARGRPEGPIDRMTEETRLSLLIEAIIDRAEALRGVDIPTALAAWSAAGGRFETVKGEVRAGDAQAMFTSESLSLSDQGRIQGLVVLDARRAEPAIAGLGGGGQERSAVSGAPPVAAPPSDTARPVQLELIFRDNQAYLGAFPVAPAPKLF